MLGQPTPLDPLDPVVFERDQQGPAVTSAPAIRLSTTEAC